MASEKLLTGHLQKCNGKRQLSTRNGLHQELSGKKNEGSSKELLAKGCGAEVDGEQKSSMAYAPPGLRA